ncbi:hypothetical protein EPA93_33275 [Ktedonosporobacter rubrisoli]|uniref:XRE family transcriptional regulator n=1 Tax=Ktedonosporobacter rubrisoli TaxID=2509675 RepID=A0A4P6JYM9_KTERU|nr:hypothetical protein [Ktedonosporobacter rubrisoli]QBD80583.1 hypothetical protein EPA93_33275 [Ktedonosporobacter rubrisoli]
MKNWQKVDIANQPTQPLLASKTDQFHEYLNKHGLTHLAIARCAHVPSITVWSIDHKLAVTPTHAQQVREALHRLTGETYNFPIDTIGPEGRRREWKQR